MVTSSSVFIPCIDTSTAVKQLQTTAKNKKWQVETHVRIENGKLGVRMWRIM